MADLVRDEKGTLKVCPALLVDDQVVLRDKRSPPAIEDGCTGLGWFDVQAPQVGNRDRERIGVAWVVACGDGGRVQGGGRSSCELDRVHVQSRPARRSEIRAGSMSAWMRICSNDTCSVTVG